MRERKLTQSFIKCCIALIEWEILGRIGKKEAVRHTGPLSEYIITIWNTKNVCILQGSTSIKMMTSDF